MTRILIALAALLLPAAALAQDAAPAPPAQENATRTAPARFEGTWDFRIDGTTIFRFTLTRDADDDNWHGTWQKPAKFRTDGNAFARMTGGVLRIQSTAGYRFMGAVELSFADNRPGAVPDVFHFEPKGRNELQMTYEGTDLAPYTLVRAGPDDPIGNWDATRIYSRVEAPAQASPQTAAAGPAQEVQAKGGQTFQIVTLPGNWNRIGSVPQRPAPAPAPVKNTAAAPAPDVANAALLAPGQATASAPAGATGETNPASNVAGKDASGKDGEKKKWPAIGPHFLDGL